MNSGGSGIRAVCVIGPPNRQVAKLVPAWFALAMTTAVDMWFDPSCPWAWLSSRWLLEVERVRNVKVTFRVMSLWVLNEGRELSDEHRMLVDRGLPAARAATAVDRAYGPDKLRDFYDAIGSRIHLLKAKPDTEMIRQALAEVECDPGIAGRVKTDEFDEALRRSHGEAIEQVGEDVGTPVIRVNGMSLFGPVISPAPKGEAAGELFDGFVKVTAYPGFFELKRTRNVGPIFD